MVFQFAMFDAKQRTNRVSVPCGIGITLMKTYREKPSFSRSIALEVNCDKEHPISMNETSKQFSKGIKMLLLFCKKLPLIVFSTSGFPVDPKLFSKDMTLFRKFNTKNINNIKKSAHITIVAGVASIMKPRNSIMSRQAMK